MRKIIVVTGVSSGIGEALVKKIPQSFPDSIIIGLGRKNSPKLATKIYETKRN